MTKAEIDVNLSGIFKRHPGVVVDWLIRSDEPRSMFFSQLEKENRKKIERFQHDIVEKLQLTRRQVFQVIRPILEELSEVIGMFFPYFFFKKKKKNKKINFFRNEPFSKANKDFKPNYFFQEEIKRNSWTKVASQKS